MVLMDLRTYLQRSKYILMRAKNYVTKDEHEEVLKLVAELSEMCEKKIPIIIKKMKLENLKKFDITVGAMSLEFNCDDDTFEEIQSRIKEAQEKELNYFG